METRFAVVRGELVEEQTRRAGVIFAKTWSEDAVRAADAVQVMPE
jgi:hypothetical protein